MSGYIEVAWVARRLGWRTERARRWLLRADAVVKRGCRYYTTPGMLQASFPEVFEVMFLGRY